MRNIILIGLLFCISLSCVSVPKEAPQLSQELGIQLKELESSHLALVHKFFDGKRDEVKTFIEEEWTPLFAENFFNQPAIDQAWDEIVESDDKEARLEFISLIVPEIQMQSEKAYREIIGPIEELENLLLRSILEKYDYSFEMNRTLTDYLAVASKTSEIRWTYLRKVGVEPSKVNEVINQVDSWTDQALQGGEKLEDLEAELGLLKAQLDSLLFNLKS